MNPLIVNVALTGCLFTSKDNPDLPITPAQIALDVKKCYDAGATIFHIHARDGIGDPTWRIEKYGEIVEKVLHLTPDAIICASCSGRHWGEFEKRAEVLDLPNVHLASLMLGSFNFPTGPSVNSPSVIDALLRRMNTNGIKPELEVFDVGMAAYARYLITQAKLNPPPYFNLFFGNRGTMLADPHVFTGIIQALPPKSIWSATGVGRYQFRVNCWAVALGGHVRVGLEDNISHGIRPRMSNLYQVERVVAVGRAMGRPPATTKEVREKLCLD